MNYCPNCGYHLADGKPSSEDDVKENQIGELDPHDGTGANGFVTPLLRSSFNSPDSVAQPRLSGRMLEDFVKKSRTLGMSYARIQESIKKNYGQRITMSRLMRIAG